MVTNLQFIKKESADNVSSLTVTDMFSAQYDVYEVFVTGNGSQNVSSLTAEFLDSGGSDIAQGAYGFAVLRLDPSSTYGEVNGTTSNSFEFAYTGSSDKDFAVKITVFNPFSSSSYTFATIQSMSLQGEKGIAVAKSTTSATSMKFYANQNYTPINVSVYGVK
jgi:hypothetical protein